MTPQFPPLMNGHELKAGQSPARKAVGGAVKGKYSAGDILWVRDEDTLDCAIVLEPEVSREEALSMVFTKMVAIGDAVGAIAPPEVAITYHWPNKVLANGRHFMTWIHTWEEDGMQPVLTQLDGRMEQGHALTIGGENGSFLGLDEHANLILKKEAGGSAVIKTIDALDTGLEAHLP